MQPKGLLSTEAITSIPVHPRLDLLLVAHFYEFRVPNQEKTVLAHQVKPGETYEVIVTTGGGLFRYATGDLVKNNRFSMLILGLEFLGRGNSHSDLVGEKLNEPQLVAALSQIPKPFWAYFHDVCFAILRTSFTPVSIMYKF
ncbi:MAG: GH3 auxin-responsive promoter family protein [Bacteroidia bacterium]